MNRLKNRLEKLEGQQQPQQDGLPPAVAELIERTKNYCPEGGRTPVPDPEPHEYEHPEVQKMVGEGFPLRTAVFFTRVKYGCNDLGLIRID